MGVDSATPAPLRSRDGSGPSSQGTTLAEDIRAFSAWCRRVWRNLTEVRPDPARTMTVRSILDAAHGPMVLLDADSRVLVLNHQAESLLGHRAVGQHAGQWFPSQPGGYCVGDVLHLRTIDQYVFHCRQLRNPDGTKLGLVLAGLDISHQLKLEAEIARVHDTSAAHLESRRAFIASASHSLRTPLAGVLSASDLLEYYRNDPPTHDRLVEVIRLSSEHLRGLIDDLAQQDAGEAAYGTLSVVHPASVINSSVEMLRHRLEGRQINCVVHLGSGVELPVMASSLRLRQLLLRLLDVATDAGDLTLQFQRLNSDTLRMTTQWAPTGGQVGGVPWDVDRLRVVAQSLQSKVDVLTIQDDHWQLQLTIPCPITSQAPPVQDSERKALVGRVLVVEDSELSAEVTRRMCETLGLRVKVAVHGKHALLQMQRTMPDIILMDCEMPIMDGYEATRAIRERYGARIPVLALTARHDTLGDQRCLEVGMNDILRKPMSLDGLHYALNRWLPHRVVVDDSLQ